MKTKVTSKEDYEIAGQVYEKYPKSYSEETFQEAVEYFKKAAQEPSKTLSSQDSRSFSEILQALQENDYEEKNFDASKSLINKGEIFRQELPKKPQTMPWHQTSSHIATLVELADKLRERYSVHALFSLGQPPAWIVKTAEEISKKTHKTDLNYPKRMFGYIPFSGRFASKRNLYPKIYSNSGQQPFYIQKRPLAEQAYRMLLASLGFSPEEIINRFEIDGIKTVLLEYAQTGESLASFLSILYLWAREKELERRLKNALTVCILKRDFCKLMLIVLPNEGICVQYDSFEVEGKFILPLANGEDEGEASDRLVPHYNKDKFGIPPETLMPNNKAMRLQITEKIITEIDFFLRKREAICQQGKEFYEKEEYPKAVELFQNSC